MANKTKKDLNNERIRLKTIKNIEKYKGASKLLINERIKSLNKEWDAFKLSNLTLWGLSFVFILLGFLSFNLWFFFALVISFYSFVSILLNQNLLNFLLRSFDFRTKKEIFEEIIILKYLNGDLTDLNGDDIRILHDIISQD